VAIRLACYEARLPGANTFSSEGSLVTAQAWHCGCKFSAGGDGSGSSRTDGWGERGESEGVGCGG
jgi:hypothetical protein